MGLRRLTESLSGRVAVVAVAIAGLALIAQGRAFGTSLGQCSIPAVTSVVPNASLTELFDSYAASKSGWTSGDGTYSDVLPDGRTAWLFSDSYIDVAPAPKPTFVHNAIVLQSSTGSLTQTLYALGGTVPQSYLDPPPTSRTTKYWPMGGVVSDGELSVFLSREKMVRGPFMFEWAGTEVATLSLPQLQLQSVAAISAPTISWGQWVLQGSDGYVYIYGSATGEAYVARVPMADPLADQADWTYFDGSAWTNDQSSAAAVASDVENEYSVTQVGDAYVLLTMDAANFFDGDVDVQFGCSAQGPFGDSQQVYVAPQIALKRHAVYAYEAHVQPQLSSEGSQGQTTLVFSYDVNTVTGPPIPSLYRPQFIDLTLAGSS